MSNKKDNNDKNKNNKSGLKKEKKGIYNYKLSKSLKNMFNKYKRHFIFKCYSPIIGSNTRISSIFLNLQDGCTTKSSIKEKTLSYSTIFNTQTI